MLKYIKKTSYFAFAFVFLLLINLSCKKVFEANFVPEKKEFGINEEITFFNYSTKSKKYLWEFGDGTTSNEKSPKKAFAKPGTYIVKLIAYSSERSREFVDYVKVGNKLELTIDSVETGKMYYFKPNIAGKVNKYKLEVYFTNSENLPYKPDFKIDTKEVFTLDSLNYLFLKKGWYSVNLTVFYEDGEVLSKQQNTYANPADGKIIWYLPFGQAYGVVDITAKITGENYVNIIKLPRIRYEYFSSSPHCDQNDSDIYAELNNGKYRLEFIYSFELESINYPQSPLVYDFTIENNCLIIQGTR